MSLGGRYNNVAALLPAIPDAVFVSVLPPNAIVLGLMSSTNLPGKTQAYRDFRDTHVVPRRDTYHHHHHHDFRTLCFDFYLPFFGKYYTDFQNDIANHDLPFFVSLTKEESETYRTMANSDIDVKYRKLTGEDLDARITLDIQHNSKLRQCDEGTNQENTEEKNDMNQVDMENSSNLETTFSAFDVISFADILKGNTSVHVPASTSLQSSWIDLMSTTENNASGAVVNTEVYPVGATVESHPEISETIHEACTLGRGVDVKRLVEMDHSMLESKNHLGQTALMIAIQYGHHDIIKHLIDFGPVNVDISDNQKQTVLHYACKYGSLEVLERLRYADVSHFNAKTTRGSTVFHYACLGGHNSIVDKLLTKDGIKFDVTNIDGLNAIHFACLSGNVVVVAKLLSRKDLGYSVLASDRYQKNAFHYACMSGNVATVEYLYTTYPKDINVCAGDKDGKNGLHLAAERGHVDVIRYLVETVHIPIESIDNHHNTALHAAIAYQYEKTDMTNQYEVGSDEWKLHTERLDSNILEVVKYFIEASGADVTAVNEFLWTVLHSASRYGRKDIVEYLLQNPIVHANVEARDENGWTAMHHAIIGGDFDVAKCLITKGNVMVNATNRDKWTALHYACRNGYFDVVRSLINDFGANITAVNKFGQTPRDVAREKNHQEIERYLELMEVEP